MNTKLFVISLVALACSACAHNPRPESPEQRAERQAQSLQAQQNAPNDPHAIAYGTRRVNDDQAQQVRAQEESETGADAPAQAEPTARTQVRERAAAMRGAARTMTMPVYRGVTGSVRGILR